MWTPSPENFHKKKILKEEEEKKLKLSVSAQLVLLSCIF